MQEKIKGIIFDYDGTLVNSMGLWERVDELYLARHHITTDLNIPRAVSTLSFLECADFFKKEFQLPDSIPEIIAEWKSMAYDEYEHHIELKPGARELISALHARQIPCAIATANAREMCLVNLKKHGLEDCFTAILSADMVGKSKAYPDIFRTAAAAMQLSAEDCAVLDDVYPALCGAKKAGCFLIGVYDRHADSEETALIKEISNIYIKTLYDFPWEVC